MNGSRYENFEHMRDIRKRRNEEAKTSLLM